MRALALVDGEHYPDVVRAAFAELPYEVAGAVLLGGTEKLRGTPDYGVPLYDGLEEGLERAAPAAVLDLSDEPVATPALRFKLAAVALAAGVPYVGADFRLDPVSFAPFELPSVAVIGTGKRVGKTAVSGRLARVLARTYEIVVVAMGRGGPAEPVVVETPPELADLVSRSRAGEHAASDYLEDATLARVTTVGCRRCGGGLAGAAWTTNVAAGARIAAGLAPDVVVFEGSGAAIPPVAADRRVLVAAADREPGQVTDYLGPYRALLSDLAILTGCEDPAATERLRAAVAGVAPGLETIATVLRPRPVKPVEGMKVALFTTAPAAAHGLLREELERRHRAEVALVSGALARRDELRVDVDSAAARAADAWLVEVKAAAIDVVAEAALERGVEVVLCDNDVQALPGEPDLDGALAQLAPLGAPR